MFLTRDPVPLPELIEAVSAPDNGAVVTFLGTVRDHHEGRSVLGLAYSAYEPMAEEVCGEIVAEAVAKWRVQVALRHRLGDLAIGEIAVGVAVSAGHRAEAFDACRYVIEELKRRVPIWKHERFADGSEAWVNQP